MAELTLLERQQNFADAIDFKQPKKIPVEMEVIGWPLAYGGMTLSEAIADPEAGAEAYCKFMDDIPYDLHLLDCGYVFPPQAYNALGSHEFVMGNDGVFSIHNQVNTQFLQDDEWDEILNDFGGYMFDKRVRKLFNIYSLPEEEAYAHLVEGAKISRNFNAFGAKIQEGLEKRNKFQVIKMFTGAPQYRTPLSQISDEIRGLKETLIDLRRRPDKIDQLISILEATPMPVNPHWADGLPYRVGMTIYHIECFLSTKQFEKYFWQPFTRQFLPLIEDGAKFILKGEGQFMNTLPYYNDLPDHSFIFMLEQDNPFEAYKIIGEKHSLIAGASIDMLQCATKEQCIDYAKRCFDTFAPGGGYIFGNNKPLLGSRDAKLENIKAVYEFADKYSRQ